MGRGARADGVHLGSGFFATNMSRHREREDEMATCHSGRASNFALWTTLIAVSCACIVSICTGANMDFVTFCFLITGFALAAYGVAFAALEYGGQPC